VGGEEEEPSRCSRAGEQLCLGDETFLNNRGGRFKATKQREKTRKINADGRLERIDQRKENPPNSF